MIAAAADVGGERQRCLAAPLRGARRRLEAAAAAGGSVSRRRLTVAAGGGGSAGRQAEGGAGGVRERLDSAATDWQAAVAGSLAPTRLKQVLVVHRPVNCAMATILACSVLVSEIFITYVYT